MFGLKWRSEHAVPLALCVAVALSSPHSFRHALRHQCGVCVAGRFRQASCGAFAAWRGGSHCMFHMSLFGARPASVCGDVLVFYIDFAEVLEIGVTEDLFCCVRALLPL